MPTPTSTSTSHNMLKYSHAESLHIRNRLAYPLRGAYCRAIGGSVVANSGREGKGDLVWMVVVAAFVEDRFAVCVWGICFAWFGEERRSSR